MPAQGRPAELATALAGLATQKSPTFRVVLSDQSDRPMGYAALAMVRALRRQGISVDTLCDRPPRNLAQQRNFLLRQADAPYVLFLHDDIWLKTGALERLYATIKKLGCGLVSYAGTAGCTLFDRTALETAGGWSGTEASVHRRVAERFGGAEIRPSDAISLEASTSVPGHWTAARDVIHRVSPDR